MTEPADDLARLRLETFLASVERTSIDDLVVLALPRSDPVSRARLMAAVTDAAANAGRGPLLREARARARRLLVDGFARRAYEPTWFGLNWSRSLGRSQDRAALFVAVEDAATAIVVEDMIDAETLDDLQAPFRAAAGMRGSAPAVNPILRGSRIGFTGRLALVVVIVLTFSWTVAGELLALTLAWLQTPHEIIQLFGL